MTVVPLCLPTAAAPAEPSKPDEVERKELARELLEVDVVRLTTADVVNSRPPAFHNGCETLPGR